MLKASNTLIVLFGALLVGLVAAIEQEVFLPPDCDVVSIIGHGFKLKLEHTNKLREKFQNVMQESAKVEVPRNDEGASGADAMLRDNGQAEGPKEKVVTNENLRQKTQEEQNNPEDYGVLDADLLNWVLERARYLTNRIERYNDELPATSNGNRIVLDILLLNTLVDIDNLVQEGIVELKWLPNKLKKLLTKNIHKEARLGEVNEFVKDLIKENLDIERSLKRTNNPGPLWMLNTQAMKRVLHEQRFSESLGKIIVEFLGNKFSLMMRSVIFSENRGPKQLDDGLFYAKAKGRVPAHFPFSAQDAISHGF